MLTPENISVAFSLIAIVISYYSYRRTTEVAFANLELYMNERITHTKERVSDISMQMGPLLSKANRTAEEDALLKNFEQNFQAAIENNLNAYDEACAKYLDNKIDKKRFFKTYRTEIRQLVEDENYKKHFDPTTSRYKPILKVYKKWEDIEN